MYGRERIGVYLALFCWFAWCCHRSLAKLEKKTDDRLTEHYTQFIQMCRVVANIAPDSLENSMFHVPLHVESY